MQLLPNGFSFSERIFHCHCELCNHLLVTCVVTNQLLRTPRVSTTPCPLHPPLSTHTCALTHPLPPVQPLNRIALPSPSNGKMTRRGPSPLLAGLVLLAVCTGTAVAQSFTEICATSNAVAGNSWDGSTSDFCEDCLQVGGAAPTCDNIGLKGGNIYTCQVGVRLTKRFSNPNCMGWEQHCIHCLMAFNTGLALHCCG